MPKTVKCETVKKAIGLPIELTLQNEAGNYRWTTSKRFASVAAAKVYLTALPGKFSYKVTRHEPGKPPEIVMKGTNNKRMSAYVKGQAGRPETNRRRF
jgi:hypothetical protein